MKGIYRFSPIMDENTFRKVLEYITGGIDGLANKLIGKSLPITTLKVFPHFPEEYDHLYKLVSGMGPAASFNSRTSYYVKVKERIRGYDIRYLGVRIVDPYRLQVGCGDYEIEGFDEFKKKYAGSSEFIRSFREDMVELWHPDFDVLGYVIGKEESN